MSALDYSPRQNWIDKLPAHLKARWHRSIIYRAAVHIHRRGMSPGHAIASAINWARHIVRTGDVKQWPGLQRVAPRPSPSAPPPSPSGPRCAHGPAATRADRGLGRKHPPRPAPARLAHPPSQGATRARRHLPRLPAPGRRRCRPHPTRRRPQLREPRAHQPRALPPRQVRARRRSRIRAGRPPAGSPALPSLGATPRPRPSTWG